MFSGYVDGVLPPEYQVPLDAEFQKVGDGLGFSQGSNPKGANFVKFYTEPHYRAMKSQMAGIPVYEEVLMVRIQAPGDKQTIEIHKATEEDFRKYPYQYEMYKRGLSQVQGTDLTKAPFLSAVQIATYEHMGIKSIEQLAGMNDTQIQSLGIDGREARKHAQMFVSNKTESVKAEKLASQFAEQKKELMAEIEKLRTQITGKETVPVTKEKSKKGKTMNGDFEEIDMSLEEALSQGFAIKEKDD